MCAGVVFLAAEQKKKKEQTHDFETNSLASKRAASCMTGCRSKCRTNLKKAFGLELSELDAEHPGDEI